MFAQFSQTFRQQPLCWGLGFITQETWFLVLGCLNEEYVCPDGARATSLHSVSWCGASGRLVYEIMQKRLSSFLVHLSHPNAMKTGLQTKLSSWRNTLRHWCPSWRLCISSRRPWIFGTLNTIFITEF